MQPDHQPWRSHYDSGIPESLAPYPRRTLLDYLAEHARNRPNGAAILFKGAKITFEALERLSNACAAALHAMGVRRGDRVALLLPNCPQFFIAEFGAWKIGAIVAPLNPIYTDAELELPLREHGIETIVTLTRYYDRVKRLQPRTALRHVVATNIKEYFPPALRLLFTLAREKAEGDRVRLVDGDFRFQELLSEHRRSPAPQSSIGGDDPAVLLMSGGTTGSAKGVLGAHHVYVHAGLQISAWISSVLAADGTDVLMLPLPLFHVYANVGVQSLAFVTGSPVALVPNPRDLDDVVKTIQRVKPAFFTGVPTLYIGLLNHAALKPGSVNFQSIKVCFSGAAPLLADTKKRFEALTGGRILEGYSLTEAMMALCVNPIQGPNKIGSVGMPLPDVLARIYDGESGTTALEVGKVGEICLSAPQLMTGFWNRPAETSEVLREHHDVDGTRLWVHTGDLGSIDEDGYVWIVDRKKDLIKSSGFQVWPREVEEVLAAHPAVAEVGVAGVPDERRGEAVCAWVVLRAGTAATSDELREHCREKIAPYKVPTRIEFRKELPRTLVGKVLRRALKDSLAEPDVS